MYSTSTGRCVHPQTTPAQNLTDTRRELLDMYSRHNLCLTPLAQQSRVAILKGWPSRRLTPAEITGYFEQSSCNLGIVCGEPSGRLIVIDFDNENTFTAWSQNNPDWCETPHVRTARGYHLYYRVDDDEPLPHNGNFYFDSRDIAGQVKSANGYVAAPPSVHPGGHIYRWIISPDELPFKKIKSISELGLSTEKSGNGKDQPGGITTTIKHVNDPIAYRAEAYSKIYSELSSAREGERNEKLRDAARSLARLATPDEEEKLKSTLGEIALRIGLNKREIISTIESGWNYGISRPIVLENTTDEKAIFEGGTIEDILNAQFPEPSWVIPNIIPEGLTLLAGTSKVGKSWLALQIVGDFSTGKTIFNEISVVASKCLYLALEDTPRRIKHRLIKQGATPTNQCYVKTEWERGYNGIYDLEKWMIVHPDTKLIVIDTWLKFFPVDDISDYSKTVEVISAIKSFADKYNIAVILIHHTKKNSDSDDFILSSLGSIGIVGSADTTIILQKKRGKNSGTMQLTGRDVREIEKAMKFDEDCCRWEVIGDVAEARTSESRREIIDLLEEIGPMKPKAISDALEKNRETTRVLLRKMAHDGEIMYDRGVYQVVNTQTDNNIYP